MPSQISIQIDHYPILSSIYNLTMSRLFSGRKSLIAIIIFATIFATIPNQASSSDLSIPRDSNSQFTLRPCESKAQFDCIESLSSRELGKKWSAMRLILPAQGSTKDSNGQVVENSISTWTYEWGNSTRSVEINSTLSAERFVSPAYKRFYPAFWFFFYGLPRDTVINKTEFRLVIRTSWLKVQAGGGAADNFSFKEEELSTGRRFTFVGRPFLSTSLTSPDKFADLNTERQQLTQSDGEDVALYFVLDHHSSIPNGSFWDASCSDFGYTIGSSNAIGAGQPYMSDNETLKFNIGAPHRLSTGEKNLGFFTTNIHLAWLDCKWPSNTLSSSQRIEVSVINEDGSSQIATTAVFIEDEILKVRASGFHYSSPSIVIKASDNKRVSQISKTTTVRKESLSGVKKKTIVCSKGTTQRRITALKPTCPSGYRRLGKN